MTRARAWVLVIAAVIAALTLVPTPGSAVIPSFTCVLCGERGSTDLLLNVLLFVPFGVALSRVGVAPRKAFLAALLFSAAIELTQFVVPGRSPTLRDVLTNALGGWLGALVAPHVASSIKSRTRARRRIWGAVVTAVALVAMTGWLLQPVSTTPDYYGQWAPELPPLETWKGRLEDVRVGALPIDYGRSEDSDALRNALRAEPTLSLTAIAGPHPAGRATIFAIADSRQHHLLMILQQGTDLIVRTYRRSSMLHLHTPELRFNDAFAPLEKDGRFTLEVHGLMGMQPCVTVGVHTQCADRLGAGSLWTALGWRSGLSVTKRTLLDGLTLFVLAFAVGLMLPAAGRTRGTLATLALIGGIALAAPMSGLAQLGLIELAFLVLGLAAGAVLALPVFSRTVHHRATGG